MRASSSTDRCSCQICVQRDEHRRRVGAPAAETALHRNPLVELDADAGNVATGCERARRFQCDVGLGGNLGRSSDALDRSCRPLVKAQLVAEIDELHRRLQQVIAVGTAADDVQAEIELRRRGPGERHPLSLPEPPAVDDDAHARSAVARAHLHGHACTGLSRIALVIDAPAALLQRHDAVRRSARATDARPARRARESSSADFRPAPPRRAALPARSRRRRIRACGRRPVSSFRSGFAGSPRNCRRTLPTPTGPRICRSVRSPRCCQSKEPEPPVSGPDTPRRPRACQVIELREIDVRQERLAAWARVAQPAPSTSTLTRQRRGNCRCMAVADQLSFCRRCFSSSLSG